MKSDFGFSCPVCQRKAIGMVWELLENENGEVVNTPFLEFDYCILSPFNKTDNNESGQDGWKRCKRNVLLIKDFNWEEWEKYIGVKNNSDSEI